MRPRGRHLRPSGGKPRLAPAGTQRARGATREPPGPPSGARGTVGPGRLASWPTEPAGFPFLCCFSDPGSGSRPVRPPRIRFLPGFQLHRLKHLPEHATVLWRPRFLARWRVGRRGKRERRTCPLPINMRGGGKEWDTPIHLRMSASLQRRDLS
jgi:hypothetical protein